MRIFALNAVCVCRIVQLTQKPKIKTNLLTALSRRNIYFQYYWVVIFFDIE